MSLLLLKHHNAIKMFIIVKKSLLTELCHMHTLQIAFNGFTVMI